MNDGNGQRGMAGMLMVGILIVRFSIGVWGPPSCETHLRSHLIFGRSTEQKDCGVQCRLLWKNFFRLW